MILEFSWNNPSGTPNLTVEVEHEQIVSALAYVEALDIWMNVIDHVRINARLVNKIYASFDQNIIQGD